MEEEEEADRHQAWAVIRVIVSAAGAVAGVRMTDRYGWGDGLIRALATVALVNAAAFLLVEPQVVRRIPPGRLALLAGFALACALYLVATFGLGERGPGGTLCVAALALFAASSLGLWLRPSATA